MEGYLGNYVELIKGFTDRGYRPIFFEQSAGAPGELIIRHDVDFDCRLAHELSLVEDGLEIKATYFFLVRSDSYNLFSRANADYVRSIHARGHRVSIHFDPTHYQDAEEGFVSEKKLFESFFDIPVGVFSVHRPNEFLKNCDAPLGGVEHTYQNKYFKDIKYVSDSQGMFRYGHPFETDACKNMMPIHLLIHPLWWMFPVAENNIDLLERFVAERTARFQAHVADNCLPYQKRIIS